MSEPVMSEQWLEHLFAADSQDLDDHPSLWQAWIEAHRQYQDPFLANVLTASRCAAPGYAFLCGYQSALRVLVPSLEAGDQVALCVTEKEGNHPRAIHTQLIAQDNGGYLLRGHKSFVTNLEYAKQLLIAADASEPGAERKQIKLVALPRELDGLSFLPKKPLGLVPEVTHGELQMVDVHVSPEMVLAGDGYQAYVKPFRTLEDLHVAAALTAHCLGLCRSFQLSRETIEQLLAALATFRGLALHEYQNAALHLALNGALEMTRSVFEAFQNEQSKLPDSVREAWQRDSQLLNLASAARQKRRENAWIELLGE